MAFWSACRCAPKRYHAGADCRAGRGSLDLSRCKNAGLARSRRYRGWCCRREAGAHSVGSHCGGGSAYCSGRSCNWADWLLGVDGRGRSVAGVRLTPPHGAVRGWNCWSSGAFGGRFGWPGNLGASRDPSGHRDFFGWHAISVVVRPCAGEEEACGIRDLLGC